AFSFDDGFDIIKTGVKQVLDHHGIKATFFITTACTDNKHLIWTNKLAAVISRNSREVCVTRFNRLMAQLGMNLSVRNRWEIHGASKRWPMAKKEEITDAFWHLCDMPSIDGYLQEHTPYFTQEDIKKLKQEGHTIGLHTKTHPVCPELSPDEISEEIIQPSSDLKKLYGLEKIYFSYPFGLRISPDLEKQLFDQGVFEAAFGTSGMSKRGTPPYQLERTGIETGVVPKVFGETVMSTIRDIRGI
ncbi:MAG: polysaccharide deacetylase family protein, partial [Pseudomonadota bacterium]